MKTVFIPDRIAMRLADALPAMMIFGPLAGLACLVTGTLAELR